MNKIQLSHEQMLDYLNWLKNPIGIYRSYFIKLKGVPTPVEVRLPAVSIEEAPKAQTSHSQP
jgi:hypothetical protein